MAIRNRSLPLMDLLHILCLNDKFVKKKKSNIHEFGMLCLNKFKGNKLLIFNERSVWYFMICDWVNTTLIDLKVS